MTSSRDRHTDLELLALQGRGSLDDRGRIAGVHGVTIASAADGCALWIGADVPDDLANQMTAVFEGATAASDPAMPPAALERCEQLLRARFGPPRRRTSLWYLMGPTPLFHPGAHIERSDSWRGDLLRSQNPGNWHPVEWDELLDGDLGPWAIATQGADVISICHTSRPMTDRAAECGVWTHPSFRGRGHASAVTSTWADILRPSGRHLFYCTDLENHSSQRVARRLQLHPLGRTWRLTLREDDPDNIHPLSRLRREATRPAGED